MIKRRITVLPIAGALLIAIMLTFIAFTDACIGKEVYSQTNFAGKSVNDSLQLKMYLSDREYFAKLQETVSSKNQYIGLQWCIDLLNKYIELEERKLKGSEKLNE
ncbi:MAG: hypothetical protein JST55_14560 [Bacteroidetes bacterium]|nr:hypothetical protein [Bacteroidota bacterium]